MNCIQKQMLPAVKAKACLIALVLGGGLILGLGRSSDLLAQNEQNATNDWKVTTVGQVRQVLLNRPRFNLLSFDGFPGLIAMEFPAGSEEEHVVTRTSPGTGLWIGAVVPELGNEIRVSVGAGWWHDDEFWPSSANWDTIWVVNRGDTVDIGGVWPDGTEDIYWPNFSSLSDQDFVSRYNDWRIKDPSTGGLNVPHYPLYLDVIEQVSTWSTPPLDEIILRSFYITSRQWDLSQVYLTVQLNGAVGKVGANAAADDRSLYFPDHYMMVSEDGEGGSDGNAISPVGFKFMPPEEYNPSSLNWTYIWSTNNGIISEYNADRYREIMSIGEIMESQESYVGSDSWLSTGPFELSVGDTLEFQLAQVFGYGLQGVLANSRTLSKLASAGFRVPIPPPPPALEVTTQNQAVVLNWHSEHNPRGNPETYKDPNRLDKHPQPFEGYRIYKSTVGRDGPWILLDEYDIPENKYGGNLGLEYEYRDEDLLNNVEYYYTVTAFSKPDSVLNWPSQESSKSLSFQTVIPGPVPPESIGEVAVVPNPYRGDVAYRNYNPPWEKSPAGRDWMEQDRRLQFINLPAQCTIKIYSAAGDYIATIEHNDPNRGFEDWNMTSFVNQAIASGLYIFSVTDRKTGEVQIGKFVVIK